MKQIHPILLQVCYNFVADYIILFFIKRDLFPEKKQFQIIKAAAIFSMTYVIWEWTTTGMPPVTREILKWCSILALICRFFKITSVSLFRKTITVFLCYLFLMGGSVTFFLTCIQIDQVKAIKEAYKAIAVLFLSSGILLAYKRKQKQEKREEEARKNIYDIQISRKGKTITGSMHYNTRKSKGNINAKRTARSKENSYRLIGKSFMENVGKTVSRRDVYIAVFLRWQKKCKNARSHSRTDCCVEK